MPESMREDVFRSGAGTGPRESLCAALFATARSASARYKFRRDSTSGEKEVEFTPEPPVLRGIARTRATDGCASSSVPVRQLRLRILMRVFPGVRANRGGTFDIALVHDRAPRLGHARLPWVVVTGASRCSRRDSVVLDSEGAVKS